MWQHRSNPPALLQAIRNRLWSRVELCFYSYRAGEEMHLPHPRLLRRDRVEDLQYYERTDSDQMQPDAYRAESKRRRAQGYHLYTLVQDGRLVCYGWLVDRQDRSEDPMMGQVFFPPKDAAVVFDCYVHPLARGRGLYEQALYQMLHDAFEIAKAGQVCIGAFADNAISRYVIDKIGFRYMGSLIKERRLWITKRYATAIVPEFRTALLEPQPAHPHR